VVGEAAVAKLLNDVVRQAAEDLDGVDATDVLVCEGGVDASQARYVSVRTRRS
jgi:hypothetical protein